MKFIIALLFLFSGAAHAQVPSPPCYPMINGAHILSPQLVVGEVGNHVFWFCSLRGEPAKVYGLSCVHDQCSAAVLHAVHMSILQSTAKVSAAKRAWDAHIKFDCDAVKGEQTPRGALCREREKFVREMTRQK